MNSPNPLLDHTGLPRFGAIKPDHVVPAIEQLLTQADAALEASVSPDSPEGPDSDMSVAGEEDPGSALDVTPHSSR